MSLAAQALERLFSELATTEDGGEEIARPLIGAETPEEMAERLLRALAEQEVQCIGYAEQIKRFRSALDVHRRREDALRRALTEIAHGVGHAMRLPLGTISPTKTQGEVVIDDASLIPDEYLRSEPDKTKIRADLKVGVVIEGARLDEPKPSVTIRRK